MGRVFVSYRRLETRHVAGRLADRLEDKLGSTQIFMDVDAIEPGADFAESIAAAVASCDVLIALIGPTWTTVADRDGRRRLDDPDDFVVLEISAALERGIRLVPVLVDGASMPRRDELPVALHGLARRQAVRVDHETFRADVEPLLATVARTIEGTGWFDPPDARPRPAHHGEPGSPAAVGTAAVDNPAVDTPAVDGADAVATSRPPVSRPAGLTSADVHDVKFTKPPIGKRGYNEDEVDAILDLVAATLANPGSTTLKSSEVENVTFSRPPIGKRGYNEDEVDAFLDLVVAEMTRREMTGSPRT